MILDRIDLKQQLDKKSYKALMPELRARLFNLQRAGWQAGLPMIVVFEGWDAAGKGTTISKLTAALDPRGFKLHPTRAPRTSERKRPWLWRFWSRLPARGEWAIFDRSWYGRVMVERMDALVQESEWRRAYRDIVDFERMLVDDGALIIKFFLHISRAEQKRRFDQLARKPRTAWQVAPEDWDHHLRYEDWVVAYDEAIERTDNEWASWTLVPATDHRFRHAMVFQTLIEALEARLEPRESPEEPELSQALVPDVLLETPEPAAPEAATLEIPHPEIAPVVSGVAESAETLEPETEAAVESDEGASAPVQDLPDGPPEGEESVP